MDAANDNLSWFARVLPDTFGCQEEKSRCSARAIRAKPLEVSHTLFQAPKSDKAWSHCKSNGDQSGLRLSGSFRTSLLLTVVLMTVAAKKGVHEIEKLKPGSIQLADTQTTPSSRKIGAFWKGQIRRSDQ